jgi:tetratricopeptide (TPR) repeat protein
LPEFLRNHPDRPKPCKPAADKCYLSSINLGPDLLPAHEALVKYHKNRQEYAKAEKAARRLLEQFPEHEQIHEDLADFLMKSGKYAEALESYQRALTHHPLNGNLRKQISTAHLHNARSLAESKRFEGARAAYSAALEFDPSNEWPILCKWASCEFKAGATARAEELLSQASAKSSRLGVAYAMLIEAIRLKLARPLKTRFDREFKEALAALPTAADAMEAIVFAASHRAVDVKYTGQKMHEKNVLAYVAKVPRASFTEAQVVKVCESMLMLEAVRPLRSLCKWGARKFRKSAMFPFIEAESYFIHGVPTNTGVYSAKHLFEDAQRLASAMPSGDSRTSMLDQIHSRQKAIEMLGGDPLGFLKNMMDAFDDLDFDDDEDDNDSW